MLKVNDYCVLRKADDAQVYTIDSIDGFVVTLTYRVGDDVMRTETDVCRVMKPSKEQMKRFLS
jgi:hypothetical protein